MKKVFVFLLLFSMNAASAFGMWEHFYADIMSSYLYDVTVEDLAIAALKELKKVDQNLTLGNDGKRVSLYYKGQVIKVGGKPQDKNDASAWKKLTEEVVAAAIEKSSEAAKRDFELNSVLAAGIVNVLDKDSKFYADIDEMGEAKRYSRRRQFAARMERDVLYLKIGAFNRQTFDEVKQALEDYSSAVALVIDIQGCPGGMAGEAVRVADLFLDGGIIASTKGREQNEETYYNATEGDLWQTKPIFIFVDKKSASAAEILTAALQEQGRAKVIGTKTQGKGTMQKLISLSDGGVMAVTSGYFMTPSGKELNGVGVIPDVCTFEMPVSKNVENLIKEQDGSCEAEEREDNRLELAIVQHLLKK